MKKMNWLGILGFLLWAPIPWLYLGPPTFLAGQPLAVYAVALFLSGLSLTSAALYVALEKRMPAGLARIYVSLFILAFVGAYQFSGLAPSWQCFGKKLQAAVGRAAGQNCTTTCTDNDKKPCSGWSTCWDKFVSCSSDGKDQDGRGCQGCCFSCTVVCEDPDPPSYQPPTVSGSIGCSRMGSNGWCVGASTLNLSASDPQGFTLTISGTLNGASFTCAAGPTCARPLPEGSGAITYQATSATSGLSSATGSTTWKRDVSAPSANPVYPAADGRNGWHITSPVAVSVGGSDAVSGVATAEFSVNDGAWQTQASLTDGGYSVNFRVDDQAGNSSIVSRMIRVDSQPPTVIPVIPNPNGWDGWFITSPVDIKGNGSDSGSGIAETWLSIDGGSWVPYAALGEGIHAVQFKAIDQAGNSATVSRTVKVDTSLPVIKTSILGTEGKAGWYTSRTITTISADDLSGTRRIEYNQNGAGWQDDSVVVSREGINNIDLRILDTAGNMASGSITIKVDATPPTISTSIEGTEGLEDWYTSPATTRISATDEISGVDRVEYDQNEAGWQNGTSVESDDGINTIGIRAYDVAGNVSTDSLAIKVDTVAPVVEPVVPSPDGLNDWFITAPVAVSASGSDLGSGLASALASVNGGKWESNLLLSDGVYTVDFQSIDKAGNTATTSQTVKIDTQPPSLSASILGTAGKNGWYVSQTNTAISALDKTSRVDRIEYNQNGAGWQSGTSVASKDGINDIKMRAYDLAGNMSSDTLQVKVDTVKPTSTFTSPGNGSSDTLARDIYALSGSSEDTTSGIANAEISLDGLSWLPLVIGSENKWTFDWDTTSWLDGIYPIVVRSTDIAGNTELTESGAHITLLVNNAPPHIKLTPEWLIWQSGTLVIKTEYFAIRNGVIVIADKDGRWPEIRIPFGEKYPDEIKWDRRFASGILAPSGDYRVTVSACNIYDLCSEKAATIKIPWYVPPLPTVSIPTKIVDVEKEAKPAIERSVSTMMPPALGIPVVEATPEIKPDVANDVAHSLLSIIALTALMWVISSAALADKRPIAIRAIAKTISSQKYKGE